MTLRSPDECEWSECVRRSLVAVLSDGEFESIAEHLERCPICQAIAEEGDDREITESLRILDNSRKSMPADLSIPVAKLNTVLSDYEILNEIGRGGMGVVYKARQIELERLVALKVLPGIVSAIRTESITRFRREAALAAQLKHSNIISIYDCGQVDGTFYYAMELIEGRSVADVIRSLRSRTNSHVSSPGAENRGHEPETPIPGLPVDAVADAAFVTRSSQSGPQLTRAYFRFVAERMAEVAEALSYAHAHGVIHRDIKPSNLLLAPDGRIMIADFGLAVRPDVGEAAGRSDTVGTYRYMSPETFDRSRGTLDHRADVYALGATLYEMLTLRPMLTASHDQEILLDILHQDPLPPRRLSRGVPRELDVICMKAAAKSPAERYDSAKALADDLNRWLLDLPIAARRAPVVARAVKFVKRHRVTVATAAVIGFAVTASVVVSANARQAQLGAQRLARDAREQRVERPLFDALCDLDQGRTDAAIRRITALVDAFPRRLEPRLAKASILVQVNRCEEAMEIVRGICKRHPDCRAAIQLSKRLQSPDATEGPEDIDELIASTNRADELFQFAVVEPSPVRAVRILDAALELAPEHIPCITLRCLMLTKVNEPDRMLRDADRIIRHRSDWSLGYGQRALALHALGQWQDARRCFDRAVALDSNQAQWLVGRSEVRVIFGDRVGAIDDASRAIAIDPGLDRAYLARATAKVSAGDVDGAIADFNTIIDAHPKVGLYYYRRSQAYRAAKKFDEELADLRTAASLDPNRIDIFTRSGQTHLELNDFEQAIVSYSQALTIQPDNPQIRFRRGMVYELSGETRQALSDYETLSIIASPVGNYAHIARFLLLRRLGNNAHADAALEAIDAADDAWMGCLRSFLSSASSRDELLACATTRSQRCEANYFIARVEMLDNDIPKAITHLRNCIALNPGGLLEVEFAELLLKQLTRPRPAGRDTAETATPRVQQPVPSTTIQSG